MPKFIRKEIDRKLAIGEVAAQLGVEAHVIRFWETKFEQIKPEIGKGHRRYYLPKDVEILKEIKHYLHDSGYTIAGLQKLFSVKKSLKKLAPKLQNNLTDSKQADLFSLNEKQIDEIEKIISNIEEKLHKAESFSKNS